MISQSLEQILREVRSSDLPDNKERLIIGPLIKSSDKVPLEFVEEVSSTIKDIKETYQSDYNFLSNWIRILEMSPVWRLGDFASTTLFFKLKQVCDAYQTEDFQKIAKKSKSNSNLIELLGNRKQFVDQWVNILSNEKYDSTTVDKALEILNKCSSTNLITKSDNIFLHQYLESPTLLEMIRETIIYITHVDRLNDGYTYEKWNFFEEIDPSLDIGKKYQDLINEFEKIDASFLVDKLKNYISRGDLFFPSQLLPIINSLRKNIDDPITLAYMLDSDKHMSNPTFAKKLANLERKLGKSSHLRFVGMMDERSNTPPIRLKRLFENSKESFEGFLDILLDKRYNQYVVDTTLHILHDISSCSVSYPIKNIIPYLDSPSLIKLFSKCTDRIRGAGGYNDGRVMEQFTALMSIEQKPDTGKRYETLLNNIRNRRLFSLEKNIEDYICPEGKRSLPLLDPILDKIEQNIDDTIALDYMLKYDFLMDHPELAKRLSSLESKFDSANELRFTHFLEDGGIKDKKYDSGLKYPDYKIIEDIISRLELMVEQFGPSISNLLLHHFPVQLDPVNLKKGTRELDLQYDSYGFVKSYFESKYSHINNDVKKPLRPKNEISKGLNKILCDIKLDSSLGIKILSAGLAKDIEEVADCCEIQIPGYVALKKLTHGGWSNSYKLMKKDQSNDKFARFLKIPFKHVSGSKDELKHFGSLDAMIAEEQKIVEELGNTGMLQYSPNFHYLPLPSFKFHVDLNIENKPTKGLVYEFIDGKNLQQIIKQNPYGLPEKKFLDIAIRAAYALSFVHKNFGTHNDVKPDNFMISSNGHVYILDLAFSRIPSYKGSLRASRHYTAPERILGNVSPTEYSDMYSFGVVLYELLTGQKPFTFEGTKEEKQKQMELFHSGKIKPKPIDGSRFSRKVIGLIMDCLEYDPECTFRGSYNRAYRSMQSVENALVRIRDEYKK